MRPSILLVPLLAACTPRAVTPPSRTFVMDSPRLSTGHRDFQIDVAKMGTIWGPDLTGSNARLRTAVSDSTILEGEAGLLHVNNEGSGGDRNAYTGRLGAIWRSEDQRMSVGAGLGGGTSQLAGSWVAGDIGVLATGKNPNIRPVIGATIGYSSPLDRSHTFTVADPDGVDSTLRLPRDVTVGLHLGIELGTEEVSVLAGLSLVKFLPLEDSVLDDGSDEIDEDETYLAAGLGVRFRVD
jgi:hypothetical protein